MRNKNCLIFGGGGFVGQNLTHMLCENGFNVTIYDRNLKEKNICSDKVNKIEGDFFRENNFDEMLQNKDVIIHLISSVSPSSSMSDIYVPYTNDVVKMLELLESCRKSGVKKVIFLSSGGTVYGNTEFEYLQEECPTNPLNNYGIMKLTIEKILLMYNIQQNMENVILRVSNPYGKGQVPKKLLGAVTVFLDKIIHDRPITIYGKGDIIRDYIEITDVCSAIKLAIEYKIMEDVQPIFNIGTGVGVSLLSIIEEIQAVTGKKANINFELERPIDVKVNVLDVKKAKLELKFESKINLHDGIVNLVEMKNKMYK